MPMAMSLSRALAAIALAVLSVTAVAQAPAYPSRPIRLVVPFPPGGAADAIARLIAQRLAERLGQPVVVDNRSGASGNIGADAVAKAAADGHTLVLGAVTSHAINHTLEAGTLSYDLERDLVPAALVASVPFVLVVHPSVPADSARALVDHAKSRPGRLSYGSSGAGAPQRLAVELLRLSTNVDMLHVPYKGSGPVIAGLVGGEVLTAFESLPATLGHIRAGRLRALAVTSPSRLAALPDVPTTAEAGWPEIVVASTFGVLVPSRTPRHVIDTLTRELATIMAAPAMADRLLEQGAIVAFVAPPEAERRIHAEIATWARVIREANIKRE